MMTCKIKCGMLLLAILFPLFAFAQQRKTYSTDWHLLDPEQDSVLGVSAYRAYKEIVKNKKGKKIVVAIIDSGCDTACEVLKSRLWVNKGEIPGNGIDDDGNGYIDDVHGWNFLGAKDGRQVTLMSKVEGRVFMEMKNEYEGVRLLEQPVDSLRLAFFCEVRKIFQYMQETHLRNICKYESGLRKIEACMKDDAFKKVSRDSLKRVLEKKQELESKLAKTKDHYRVAYDERSVIGDDPGLIIERGYGNSILLAEGSEHGNCVAGCIGALPNTGKEVQGIARDVELMIIRAVAPVGAEHDKDIVNAIRYAVDNGANIISMSFGVMDQVSTQKYVQEAFGYAARGGVLMVHAAGNNMADTDARTYYPHTPKDSLSKASFITVGNSGTNLAVRHVRGALVSGTSNYGQTSVDLFAPGMYIYCPSVNNEFVSVSGTSFSAPVVSGVAALVWSQYPELTAPEIKKILMNSVFKVDQTVKRIDRHFSTLSISGGIVNAYRALKLARIYAAKKR